MGIFKSFTKILKKAAPIIGGAIGFSFGSPFLGTALGTGIGTLVAGGDTEDAFEGIGLMGGILDTQAVNFSDLLPHLLLERQA